MKRLLSLCLPLIAACLAAPASAQDSLPASCQPKVAGVALALAGEANQAQLQCDVDRAAVFGKRSEAIFGPVLNPLVEIVDTLPSPSGAAYVYAVSDVQGTMILDARSVPVDLSAPGKTPVCRLRTLVPDAVASQVSLALLQTASPDVPGYAERMEVIVNPDGSHSSVLMLDAHDVVTTLQTADGERHFSRHIRQTDRVAKLNELIIGVANVSDGWTCDTP